MRYPFLLFDWGDTLMKDDPGRQTAMYTWPHVEAIPGAPEVLRRLEADGRTICLATSAEQSDEEMIRRALRRVDLDASIGHIFCSTNVGAKKTEPAFYPAILERLQAAPAEAIMIGDNFEYDVLAANRAGMHAVWFNPGSSEERRSEMFDTIHTLADLFGFLEGG